MSKRKIRSVKASLRKRCPVCLKDTMRSSGYVKAGPRGGRRKVYSCKNCGYRSIK